MKKKTKSTWKIFSCAFILILAVAPSCKKNPKLPDESHEKAHVVKFKIKDFETIVNPLKGQSPSRSKAASTTAEAENQVLYYWDFDRENADPTVALESPVQLDYNTGKTDYNFVAGWPSTGKAISFRGVKEVLVKIPLSTITRLGSLSFDANSSATGPRALVLSYSTDKGSTFAPLTDTLHYPSNLTSSAKFAVDEPLSPVATPQAGELWLKISLFEGNRAGASDYNPVTGTFKMDNLKISGIADQSVLQSKLYYHIFDAGTKIMIKSGSLNAKEVFDIILPEGNYYLSLVAKNSTLPFQIANTANDINSFYISNPFKEHDAETFAARDTFEVKDALERKLTLNRIYSEIQFEFIDTVDLSQIDSVQVRQLHPAFLYYPFVSKVNDKEDPALLTIIPAFSGDNKNMVFNQFMGDYLANKEVKYELSVFRQGEMIRRFMVESSISNNVQLLFKGKLLEGFKGGQGFVVEKNEKWKDNIVIEY
ncbi:hypothetical protein HX021_05145 [Sphingobacterium sp. N143]|uniref:hypothetical protein n=1 Tax=Sphingobacterium sp. N143 TaxID=2746727 RepID=UPI0025749D85|nr:hypothetical protein [Sphingobacterium sp. N143]MDM1293680.1 hypothetical protein [Sphingobacterium sp. N143]